MPGTLLYSLVQNTIDEMKQNLPEWERYDDEPLLILDEEMSPNFVDFSGRCTDSYILDEVEQTVSFFLRTMKSAKSQPVPPLKKRYPRQHLRARRPIAQAPVRTITTTGNRSSDSTTTNSTVATCNSGEDDMETEDFADSVQDQTDLVDISNANRDDIIEALHLFEKLKKLKL